MAEIESISQYSVVIASTLTTLGVSGGARKRMTWTIPASTYTFSHDAVRMSPDGYAKVATTPSGKHWRLWLLTDRGNWVLHPQPFRKCAEAQMFYERMRAQ